MWCRGGVRRQAPSVRPHGVGIARSAVRARSSSVSHVSGCGERPGTSSAIRSSSARQRTRELVGAHLMGRVINTAGPSRRSDRWAMRAFAVGMLGVLAFSWWVARDSLPDDGQEVLRVERSGPLVVRDEQLARELSGTLEIDERAAAAAFCVNGPYWAGDVTVDLDVMVSTNPRHYRVGELVADRQWSRSLVTAVETDLMSTNDGSDNGSVSDEVIARFGRSQVESYLADTTTAPRVDVVDSFVVYAVSTTTTAQQLYIIDRRRIDRDAIARFAASRPLGSDEYDVKVAGGSDVEVHRGDCARVSESVPG